MVELTRKQAEFVEIMRKSILDPEIQELTDNQNLLNAAPLLGYVVKEEAVHDLDSNSII
ncbi:TPA: hypothetical protein U1265_000557 [Streptococcus suis]|nr:hypothetical protein [Streptococcus suis]HEM5097829.1 hypothetical protein [Streptococcus suis]HEM5099846.1 hypothetical protein [Streptococcus suis]HEM5102292.1 hypothetical protein [Streptococcus suis]HEM5108154.1 hypothetical protein [Streptococcus suis]